MQALRSTFGVGGKRLNFGLLTKAWHLGDPCMNKQVLCFLFVLCMLQHSELLTRYILVESNKGEAMCFIHYSVEGTRQSAGEGTCHIGNLAASAKHNMSTA